MQNSIWKLTALAGLVGIGFLVVLQAQRGMPGPGADPQAVTSSDSDEKPARSRDSDAEQALLFDQREPSSTSHNPDDNERSHAPPFEPAERASHSLARSEDRSDAARENPFAADRSPAADDHDEPGQLTVGDARPLLADESGRSATSDSFPEHTGSANPFAADSGAVEVVIQPRRQTGSRSASAGTVSPASGEMASSSGPQLLMVPNAERDLDGGDPSTLEAATGTRIQPIPERTSPFDAESPFPDDDAASPADSDDASRAESAESAPLRTADGAGPDSRDELPAFTADENDGHSDGGAPRVPGVEELPASEADSPSALRLHPADGVLVTADDESRDAPSFGAPPAVAADPFPSADADSPDTSDRNPPLLAAPGPAESTADTGEPARLPTADPLQQAKPLDPARVVPLASDDLKGDGTVAADGPKGSQQPQLTIEKKAPSLAVLGKPLVYSILVRNVGQSPAHQVVVEDRIPKGSRLTGTIPRAELIEKKLVWKLGVLKPGEEQQIAVRVVPVEEGQIGSIATVNFVAEVASRTTITAPKLHLSLNGPDEARRGQAVTFRFELANRGDGTASNVYLRNIIPDELHHAAGHDLEYKVGDLAPGQSREINLTLTAAKAGSATNRAIITADGGISVESTAELQIIGSRLRLERNGPKRRFVGRDGEFTNTVTNESDAALSEVRVVETVPPGLNFLQATHGGRWDATARTVTWSIARLAPRERKTFNVKLAGRALGRQSSEVTVRTAEGDEAQVTSETQIEGFAALDLSVADNKSPIEVGDTITLRVVAKNRGTEAASDVRVNVSIPAEMEFLSAQGPVQHTRAPAGVEFAAIPQIAGRAQEEFLVVLKAVKAGTGDARVQIRIDADQMARPLNREEVVYILPETP